MCQICNEIVKYAVPHYIRSHPEREVFVSRLSYEMANMARNQEGQFVSKLNTIKIFNAFCYFCGKKHQKPVDTWMEHFRCRTGEYAHECSICKKRSNSRIKCCGKKVRQKITFDLHNNDFTAFLCRLCNYIQINEENVHKHLFNEHELDDIHGQLDEILLLPSFSHS